MAVWQAMQPKGHVVWNTEINFKLTAAHTTIKAKLAGQRNPHPTLMMMINVYMTPLGTNMWF